PYWPKTLELLAQAETAKDADTRANFEGLAAAFLRLAMQVERNEGLVIDFVLPPQGKKQNRRRFSDRPPCLSAFEVSSYRTVSDSEPVIEIGVAVSPNEQTVSHVWAKLEHIGSRVFLISGETRSVCYV